MRGGPRDFSAWLASNRVHRRLLSSRNRFACSRNSTTYLACSSCLASISWRQRRNWSSGGWFAGLLDMTVSSDGSVGCWRMDKASDIGRSPGSEVYLSSPVLPLRFLARNFPQTTPIIVSGILKFSESSRHSLVTSRLQPAKQIRRQRWCSVAPSMAKLAFLKD